MIRSMTGYGEAEGQTASGRLRVELRSVNHRYLNVNSRTPAALARLEPEIREELRGFFARGHLNCTVQFERDGDPAAAVGYRVDTDRVAGYLAMFETIRRDFDVEGRPDLALLARFGDIFVRDDPEAGPADVPAADVRAVVAAAASQTVRMREDEGRRLARDLEGRLEAVEGALREIEVLAPERLASERDRLTRAVSELLDGRTVDEARVAQEIAILAERWDINEELVRFASHIELFRDLLAAEDAEAVGKRLGFLVQEMHREANTIGSKANSAAISHLVVAIKDEVERLREQVENVE